MRLRAKINLLVGSILLPAALAVVVLVLAILSGSFGQLEETRALDDARRAYGFLEQQYSDIRSTATDWSEWDDTYQYAGGEAGDYVANNLTPETFEKVGFDAIGFIDERGRLRSFFTREGRVELARAPEAVRALFPVGVADAALPASRTPTAGVIVPPTGTPMIVALSGIRNSLGGGPRRGTLVLCRSLDTDMLNAASVYLRLPLRVSDRAPSVEDGAAEVTEQSSGVTFAAAVLDGDRIAGYAAVTDMRREATLTLQTVEPRVMTQAGRLTAGLLVLGIACVAIAGVVGFLAVFDRQVRTPLARLADGMLDIEKGGDYGGRVSVDRSDEIGDVAAGANRMLEALGTAREGLEASEYRFRALFESNPVGTLEIDASAVLQVAEGLAGVGGDIDAYLDEHPDVVDEARAGLRLLAANHAAALVFGAPDVDHMREGFAGLTSQDPVRRAIARSVRALAHGEDSFSMVVDLVRFDGTPASIRFDWHVDAHGKLLLTAVDVTSARVSERSHEEMREQLQALVDVRTAELKESNRELREATQTKDRFLANMSHELRTPLNSVIGFSGLLSGGLAGPLNEEQCRQVGMIRASGERLLGLVTEILDLSRLEAGMATPQPTVFDAGAATESLIETLRPTADLGGLELTLSRPACSTFVRTDRTWFEGIVLNIVGNALKHTERGSVTVTLATPLDSLELTVADTGPGIPETELGSIFEDFRQLPDRRDAKPPGAGLGLAISRRYASLLGGRIDVASTPGEGSVFVLTLPATFDEGRE